MFYWEATDKILRFPPTKKYQTSRISIGSIHVGGAQLPATVAGWAPPTSRNTSLATAHSGRVGLLNKILAAGSKALEDHGSG